MHDTRRNGQPTRCAWAGNDDLYIAYHDHEWGRPLTGDAALFERISLEGFQAGLSWLTILRKRPAFRQAFAGFDIDKVAAFGARDVERLLGDAGIVRHRGKIEAVVNNAQRAVELRAEAGSLSAFLWRYEPAAVHHGPPRAESPESRALSKELKRRGWRFVGPTTMYSLMQAVGMVNDHGPDCMCHAEVERLRKAFERPGAR
ncbi:DNA-3-methyladenine glycosylase I [Pigmentiphaga sp. NML080357]|uniref:DNA-3-methyladenine glycosylase I n=1 Tax=Pigmentiphaga sp. NML080357 TaxID=2008675 RepID=UPI000B409BFF|nr:DNA-3-methyladenine glycosylase I [Pigmentiphaga sp. NML080357]OVZ58439.1 DNA-3-methyladenine glycosylase I [Pigmentiphaga sp. NML080357]